MSYSIKDLKNHKIDSLNYFIDANAWVYFIEGSQEVWHSEYIRFFNDLFKLHDEIQAKIDALTAPDSSLILPKIILTPMLISEMFNVLVRTRFKEWKDNQSNSESLKFKEHFRPTQDHEDAFKHLRSEILSYERYFEIVDDSDEQIGVINMLENFNYQMDFNDQCYYFTCLENGYTVITNDVDFFVEGVDIYTSNGRLLKKMRDYNRK